MRDVFRVCSGSEPTETGLAGMETHAHMTSCLDGHLVFKEVRFMDEVRVRAIVVRGCSACDIGQWATGERWRRPEGDGKASWMRQLLQNIDQKNVVSLEKIIYKKLSEIVLFREWATYNDRKYHVIRNSKIVESALVNSRSREVVEGGNALP